MTTSRQFEKLKNNNDIYSKEKERINSYIKNKYATNPEFREKVKAQAKARRERLKSSSVELKNI